VLSLSLAFFACKQQDEMYSQYVVEGGRVYPHKAENATVAPGIGRVEISWPNTTRTVTSACIYWNTGRDTSVCVDVTAQTDTVRRNIELPEGLYSFTIKTFDKDGNVSVPVEIIGRSMGDNYLSGFLNRMTTGYKTRGGAHLVIEWDAADLSRGALYCDVVYTATDNSEKTVRAPAGESATEIEDHKPGSAFKYNTTYRPDPQYPLEITTGYREITGVYVLLDNKGEDKVIDFSSQHPDPSCYASHGYDGIYTKNRWHTQVGGAYPHHITIDLGIETSVARFGIWPSDYDGHFEDRMPSRIEWWVSTNNVDWDKLGEYNFIRYPVNSYVYDEQRYEVAPVNARYIKLVGLDNPEGSGIMCLGEIDVYTKMGE
jgi:hypothetical protein